VDHSKYLKPTVLKIIEKWIKKVRKHKYKSEYKGDTKAWKKVKLPFKVVGCGYNRIVYDMGKGLVLKIAVTISGLENNKTEAKINRKAHPKIKNQLAKVKECGDGRIIMENIKKKLV
jgi:hypothetical protein